MKKFLDNIVHSKLGGILDHLFLGFKFFLPKFSLYLMIPTLVFSLIQRFGILSIPDSFMMGLTFILLPIFILGAFWYIYRTTGK
jgi:hypothetical protein